MEEKQIYKYAFYNIDGKDFYQYLPTSNLKDVIYVKGMKSVKEKNYIRDGDSFIEVVTDHNSSVGIGEPLYSSNIVRRYYESDPVFQDYDEDTIDYLKTVPKLRWTLEGDGNVSLGRYQDYASVNIGEVPIAEVPHDVISGSPHWYLELYHDDDTVTYEKTLYDDRKYRGQECNHYDFVKVVEYAVDGEKRAAIIERDPIQYNYHSVPSTFLSQIVDQAKGLISHQGHVQGFSGVSPLYAFNTEDSACVFYDHRDQISNQVVTTVTGSGDAILDLFLNDAKKVIAFDTNYLTRFYGELKFVAAKHLSFEEYDSFFSNLNEEIYSKLESHLSCDTREFWSDLYSYSKVVEKKMKDPEQGGLFYPTMFLFTANGTIRNKKGYYNKENYLRLQQKLQDKTLEDICFVTCDLLDLPQKTDLSQSSYVYLSNIMDFMVGVDTYHVDDEKLKAFKEFVLNDLKPSLSESANIDLSYLDASWHQGIDRGSYLDVYPLEEGFQIRLLSNRKDHILSYQDSLLLENRDVDFEMGDSGSKRVLG